MPRGFWYCKIATFWAICKNSVQRFHRSVQPFHTFLEIAQKVSNIAFEFGRNAPLVFAGKESRNFFKYVYMAKGKRVRISNESVNCYGTRILTPGIDLAQYQRNPVLLYMHERGKVVGMVKDLKVEGQDVTGELVFDEATELSKQLKKQWEFGSVKMVSANFQILEKSDDKQLLAEGQQRPTVTKSKLIEVSVVDIGGNDDAIVLTHEGKTISLSAGQDSIDGVLPLLDNVSKTPLKKKEMELKDLAIKLGLKETATEEEVNQKLVSLSLAAGKVTVLETQVQTLQAQQQAVELAAITRAVETAITEKRLAAGMKEHFIELGKKLGLDQLNITLSAMQPQGKITATLHRTDKGNIVAEPQDYSKYEKLSAVPANVMMDLHDNHHDEFVRLYKAEYGFEPAR